MRGTPVWLASVSRHSRVSGGRLSTQVWSDAMTEESTCLLRRMLGPAGDPLRERIFRMQITLCIHRALTPAEITSLPDWFHADEPVDLAGGPVAVLWENEEGSLSTRPCHAPERAPIDRRNPLLWMPFDCGTCEPCRARSALKQKIAARRSQTDPFLTP